jgi:hypothetical protein
MKHQDFVLAILATYLPNTSIWIDQVLENYTNAQMQLKLWKRREIVSQIVPTRTEFATAALIAALPPRKIH